MKLGTRSRGRINDQLRYHFNTLELRTGPAPSTPDAAAMALTGTRLVAWSQSVPWGGTDDLATLSTITMTGDIAVAAEATGIVGYACLRHVYSQEGDPLAGTLTLLDNQPTSAGLALLTVGLVGSGADLELDTLNIQAGTAVMLSRNSFCTVRE